eukprot:Skav212975  [mRNA]  locus=scaffold423:54590:55945:- [translate_table: standard]
MLRVCDLLETIKVRALQPSIVTFGSAISALQPGAEWEPWELQKRKPLSRPWQMALELFDQLRQTGLEANVFVCSSVLPKTADWRGSVALFRDMKLLSVSANLVTFGALISACERHEQWVQVLELKDHLVQRNLENNLHTLCTAMSACEKGWEISLSLLGELRQTRLKPNAFACSAVVRACAGAPNGWVRALHFFFELEQSKVQVNAVALGTALAACELAGRWELALQLMVDRVKISDLACFNCAISSCERGSKWQHALVLFAQARLPNDSTYSAAMLACRKANQWQRALCLWCERSKVTYLAEPTAITWSAAVSAAESGSQWQLALVLLELSGAASLQLDGIIYSAASSACQRSGQWRWPLQFIEIMQSSNIELSMVVQSIGLEAASVSGWKSTVDFLEKMQCHGPASDSASDSEVVALATAACDREQQHEQLCKLLGDSQQATVKALHRL